jgi:hypothetical protein
MANTYLTRTPSSAGNKKTFTFSAWLKGHNTEVDGSGYFFTADVSGGSNIDAIGITASGLQISVNSANSGSLNSSRLFRDMSSWYHIVWSVDTTQATASNRMKIYVNGVQETAWDTETYPSQNYDFAINGTTEHNVSYRSGYFSGLMTHVHFIDGTAYDASAFGETDATTGEWKAKTSPSVTYGTNGFFILKDGNGITDQSGEGNDFTLGGGTLTDLKDNPDNVFATFNPLIITSTGGVAVRTPGFENSNTTALFDDNGNNEFALSTLAPSKGKYYAEFKWVNATGSGSSTVGIVKANFAIQTDVNDQGIVYKGDGNKVVNNSSSSYGASWTTGDIIGIALDCDSNTVNFYKNSVAQGSISIDADTNWYIFCSSYALSSTTRSVNANFGNGYFGTTAISSAGSNGNGSLFEYDVPSGYYALNTKNINTYG